MKKLRQHSRTSLFMMELIIAILFLALCSAATIRLFSSAYIGRVKARQLNRIQDLVTNVGRPWRSGAVIRTSSRSCFRKAA